MAKESQIVASIREALKGRAVVYKNHGGRFSAAGRPDIEVVFRPKFIDQSSPARVVFLEVKRPGEKLTKIQLAEFARLVDIGAAVAVVHSKIEAIEALRAWGME